MDIAPALAQQLDAFIEYLRFERNLSPKTRDSYLRQLTTVASQLQLSDWSALTPQHVKSLLTQARKQKLSPRSIAQRLSALRSFCDFLISRGVLDNNPAKLVQAPKQGRPLPKQMNVDEINQLLEIDDTSPLGIRDRAMMEVMYGCGLRLAELCDLNLNSVFDGRQLRVFGKGSKERILPMGKMAQKWLQNWLKVRPLLAPADEPALFVSKHKRRISHRQVAKRMKLWAQVQHLNQNVNPHKLRHSYATHMLESSGDLRAVQELLGHANLSTTQVYTHLDFNHLANVYDQAHPRAKRQKQS